MRNYSVYPAPPFAGEARVRIAEEIELQAALDKVWAVVAAQPYISAEPTPKVLLDRSAAENALEIVITFSTGNDEVPNIKSELIKALHDGVPGTLGRQASQA